jgi:hypothetical protein
MFTLSHKWFFDFFNWPIKTAGALAGHRRDHQPPLAGQKAGAR